MSIGGQGRPREVKRGLERSRQIKSGQRQVIMRSNEVMCDHRKSFKASGWWSGEDW